MLTAMNMLGNSCASARAGSSPVVPHRAVGRGEMADATVMQNASSFIDSRFLKQFNMIIGRDCPIV